MIMTHPPKPSKYLCHRGIIYHPLPSIGGALPEDVKDRIDDAAQTPLHWDLMVLKHLLTVGENLFAGSVATSVDYRIRVTENYIEKDPDLRRKMVALCDLLRSEQWVTGYLETCRMLTEYDADRTDLRLVE